MAAVTDAAAHLTHASSDSLVLLGAEATYPETDYGWIQPGSEIASTGRRKIHRIEGFVEKPTQERADRLMRYGGLWNTMVMIARAASLWRLVADFAPELAVRFSRLQGAIGTDREQDVLNWVYQTLPLANFSSMVLAHCPERLLVVPIKNVLWSDWGRGERIVETLERIKGPSLLVSPMREGGQEAEHAGVALTI
jgi:mannose-1-phosphate guanylyltransferase